MNNYLLSTICIVMIILGGCRAKRNNPSPQEIEIKSYFGDANNIKLTLYKNGLIKFAQAINPNGSLGSKIEFSETGEIKKYTYQDTFGQKKGNESFFYGDGSLWKHLFWRDPNNLLFYIDFEGGSDDEIAETQGKPWLIRGKDHCLVGDTITFITSIPMIPKMKIKTTIWENENPDSKIVKLNSSYLAPPIIYKFIAKNTGQSIINFKVKIEGKAFEYSHQDSTNIKIQVGVKKKARQ